MHQAFAVSSVDFIAVLIVEESSDVLKSFRDSAVDGRSAVAASLSRSNCESRVTRGDLGYALSSKDVAHVN
jgi:hypothetical protein